MGQVISLPNRRQPKPSHGSRFVVCEHCAERHPVVRLADGTHRCPTAFADDGRWFCRNRGCRAAWIEKQQARS